MGQALKKLAVVTGASSGIGLELARLCARHGYDLVIAADQAEIETAASELRAMGADVQTVETDLSRSEGVDELCQRIEARGQDLEILCANAGHGLGHAFLEQEPNAWRHVVDTNITGTLLVIQNLARIMQRQGHGRILVTGSIAGFTPGSYQAVYNGTKAFINSFSFALRNELEGSGVSVSCLMPGATETDFFERAGMLDTKVGQAEKDDPRMVAKVGFEAMMAGEGDVVSGWKNKLQTMMANVTPSETLAEQHRKMAEPGSGRPS